MNNWIETIWGYGRDLTVLQVSIRALVMFFIALILVRLGGVRIFGKKSAFDEVVAIMLGAILSRSITGASPFGNTIAAAAVLVLIHRILAYACTRSHRLGALINGRPVLLFKNGVFLFDQMTRCSLSEKDLEESLRLHTGQADFKRIKEIFMEPSGRISFIKKDNGEEVEAGRRS